MAKVSNTTAAIFEFVYDQTVTNANGKRLHEFDIVNRFRPVLGQRNALRILDRLSQKHHLLKSTSTQTMATGRQTSYYRANPDNPYYDNGSGRKAAPEVLKKLEKLRAEPLVATADNPPVVVDIPTPIAKSGRDVWVELESQFSAGAPQTKAPDPEPSRQTNVLCLVEGISENEGKDQISLLLDLGASRTEIVDVETAYKLFLGLKSIFERT